MRRSALVLVAALLSAAGSFTSAQAAAPGPRVIRDVQAGVHVLEAQGQQQQDTAIEPSISVNPRNPLNAVAVFQTGRVDAGCAQVNGYATTFDGGKTWRSGAFPKLTVATGGTAPLASDPVVAFGPGNIVYANHLTCNGELDDLAFSVSKDGGKTWGAPIYVPTERTFPLDDKNWIAVDNGKGEGHHYGRVYMVWDNVAPVVAMYSDDQAQTWQGPFVIWPGQGIGTYPLVMPNGDLAVVFSGASPVPPLFTADSTQDDALDFDKFLIAHAPGAGGVATGGPLVFTPATPIATDRGVPPRYQRAGDGLPMPAIDPKTGRIYVSWMDNRFRTDVTNDIVMTFSDDGMNWSPVRRVNPGGKGDFVEHFTPAVEVGRDGIVRIMYRQQKQTENADDIPKKTPYVDTFYQQTKDGKKFTAPLKVNRRPSDIRYAAFSRQSAFFGDYSQIAVTGSWAYVVRTEAFRIRSSEPAEWPPLYHHQRAWVAVVDSDGNGRP
jgi:hypothetical protein